MALIQSSLVKPGLGKYIIFDMVNSRGFQLVFHAGFMYIVCFTYNKNKRRFTRTSILNRQQCPHIFTTKISDFGTFHTNLSIESIVYHVRVFQGHFRAVLIRQTWTKIKKKKRKKTIH